MVVGGEPVLWVFFFRFFLSFFFSDFFSPFFFRYVSQFFFQFVHFFQIIRCFIKPVLKNSTRPIFQGGTPWVAQILNNIIVWMVLYCAQQLLGMKKNNKNNFYTIWTFLWVKLVHLLYHIDVKTLKCKVFQITRYITKPL